MRNLIVLAIVPLSFAGPAWGQSNCRDISAGGFIQPDEIIMQTAYGYVACKVVKAPVAAKTDAPSSTPAMAAPPVAPAKGPLGEPARTTVNHGDWSTPLVQVAAGYQYNSVNGSTSVSGFSFSTSRVNTNGAFTQVMFNINRYISPVGSFDISYKNEGGSNYLLTYLGGVQAYPLSHGRWSPFARAMFGAGTLRVSGYSSETGFSWQIGGGLDWHFGREGRLALRLGTFDYARTSKDGVNLNSLKVGTGIVF
jgi:hypothetical protein